MKKESESLYVKLKKYSKSKACPMHMPGHKRRGILGVHLPYDIDITEIADFDNLQEPKGILKETCNKIQALYRSEHSFMLINGSTCGNHAGIRAATNAGDKVLVARNCHKSVFNALELNFLNPLYLALSVDESSTINNGIDPKNVEKAIKENPDIKLVIITSPTYEGVISDVKSIAQIAHKHGIPLLVDEAHGAHLFYSKNSAVDCGADIVINSLHKTLPSFTQTAVAHLNGKLVSKEKFARALAVFESTSPSYVLLASIDACIRFLEKNAQKTFSALHKNLDWFETQIEDLEYLKVICYGKDKKNEHIGFFDFDRTKIVISTIGASITGYELLIRLREEFKIELEMAYNNYALAMVTIFDDKRTLKRLALALKTIDKTLSKDSSKIQKEKLFSLPQKAQNACEVRSQSGELVKTEDSKGRVSLEYVWAYPPGIPLLVPGEIVDENFLEYIRHISFHGVVIHSTLNFMPQKIMVMCDKL